MIKNHNDKVTKARLIKDEYWSLLFETSRTVNDILVASKRVLKAIDLYELEIKCRDETIPYNDDDTSSIDTCLNRVTSWNEACKRLTLLQSRFERLGKSLDEQKEEWKKLQQSLRLAAWCIGGIIGVVSFGATIAFGYLLLLKMVWTRLHLKD